MNSLINKTEIRRFLLERAKTTGRTRFTRVSAELYESINRKVAVLLEDTLHRHPSKGATLYPL